MRDVLPDEMGELRALSDALRRTFVEAGYGEVWTPALEFEEVLRAGDPHAAGASYKLFDEHGRVLALRSDMTIPIARLAATRLAGQTPPLRLCYFAHAYRAGPVRADHPHEFLQAGIELLGLDAPEGEAEVIALTLAALRCAGLERHRVGVGDATLMPSLLRTLGIDDELRKRVLDALRRRDLVAVERLAGGIPDRDAGELLVRAANARGGPEVLAPIAELVPESVRRLARLHELLAASGDAERVILDLGLRREFAYYTGIVFEIYDPAVGFALGGGGRYDELVSRFGRQLSGCGVALDVQRVHVAQAAEEGWTGAAREVGGTPRGGTRGAADRQFSAQGPLP
ncbi:ATP phosphoribosyltransferase regulatory subunit [Thermoleophilum album]|nr:ATP phosphoribosyltransferase regulatory subunit [Thermoleophilum album]